MFGSCDFNDCTRRDFLFIDKADENRQGVIPAYLSADARRWAMTQLLPEVRLVVTRYYQLTSALNVIDFSCSTLTDNFYCDVRDQHRSSLSFD